jgi:PAS domain S-box-containing protein
MEKGTRHLIVNVDDRDSARHARSKILSQAGFVVEDAASGRDALQIVLECRPDLVLLSVRLPDLDGIELCRRLREGAAGSRLVIVRVSPDARSDEACLDGADACLAEPLHPDMLVATLRALLRARAAEERLEEQRAYWSAILERTAPGLSTAGFGQYGAAPRLTPQEDGASYLPAEYPIEDSLKTHGLLREIVTSVPAMIAVLRAPDFVYEFVNPAFQAIAPDRTIRGRRFVDVWTEFGRVLLPTLERVIATGEPFRAVDSEFEIHSGPGVAERRYFTYSWTPLPGPLGKPDRVLVVATETTEAVRQRQQLAEALARNEAIFANITEGVMIADAAGNVLSMNPAALRFHGLSGKDALRNLRDFKEFSVRELDGRPVPVEEWPLARVLRGETLSHCELRVTNAAQGREWVATYGGSPVLDDSGNVVFGVLTFHDITGRKRMEHALRESVEQFRTLADSIAQFAWMADENGWTFWYNRRWYEYTGTTLEEMQGWGWRKVHHPDHVDRVVARIKHSYDTGEPWEDTFPLRGKDGKYRWFLSRAMPIRDERGRVIRWFGTNTDITEQLETERRLSESEREFRQLADSIPDAVWVMGAGGGLEYLNQRFLEFTGLPAAEAYDPQVWRRIVHPDDMARREHALSEFYRKGGDYTLEFRLKGADGSYRWKIDRGVAVRNQAGQLARFFGTITDIHDQKMAEEVLRQTQKLESVGLLAGGIAHDFNNLLTGIIGNASMAVDMVPAGSPLTEILKRVIQSGEQAAHLTRQLLAYAGKGRFVVQPVNLSTLVGETGPLIQSSISKSIGLHFRLEPDIPAVETDPSQMQQVFMNLAINAAEAIGSGPGVISVATGETVIDRTSVSEGLSGWPIAPGRHVYLEVRDTGAGMDASTRAKIFDPFFTTKLHGRGLGLAAVAGIVRAHNGAIQVSSEPGEGTVFRVLLPAVESPQPAEAESRQAGGDLRGSGTVLVVDDEEVVRELAARALARMGYEVLVAKGGAAAIDVVRAKGGRIDLVVLDLSMPGMNGQEALPLLRELEPDLKVVISSGYNEAETLGLFRGTNVSGYIQKPYTVQDLARKVKSVLG